MVCKCHSSAEHASRAASQAASSALATEKYYKEQIADLKAEIASLTPDNSKYEIVDAQEVDGNLVMMVRYASCQECAYEGEKVMVFLGVSAADALKWKTIDPHFRMPHDDTTKSPSPSARFPASKDGWEDALEYARRV